MARTEEETRLSTFELTLRLKNRYTVHDMCNCGL